MTASIAANLAAAVAAQQGPLVLRESNDPDVTFTGHNRDGTAVTGRLNTDVSRFVEDRYNKGWRDLVVRFLDGEEAGGIYDHPDTGRRTWWSWR